MFSKNSFRFWFANHCPFNASPLSVSYGFTQDELVVLYRSDTLWYPLLDLKASVSFSVDYQNFNRMMVLKHSVTGSSFPVNGERGFFDSDYVHYKSTAGSVDLFKPGKLQIDITLLNFHSFQRQWNTGSDTLLPVNPNMPFDSWGNTFGNLPTTIKEYCTRINNLFRSAQANTTFFLLGSDNPNLSLSLPLVQGASLGTQIITTPAKLISYNDNMDSVSMSFVATTYIQRVNDSNNRGWFLIRPKIMLLAENEQTVPFDVFFQKEEEKEVIEV
jgi:hypothetical protein